MDYAIVAYSFWGCNKKSKFDYSKLPPGEVMSKLHLLTEDRWKVPDVSMGNPNMDDDIIKQQRRCPFPQYFLACALYLLPYMQRPYQISAEFSSSDWQEYLDVQWVSYDLPRLLCLWEASPINSPVKMSPGNRHSWTYNDWKNLFYVLYSISPSNTISLVHYISPNIPHWQTV